MSQHERPHASTRRAAGARFVVAVTGIAARHPAASVPTKGPQMEPRWAVMQRKVRHRAEFPQDQPHAPPIGARPRQTITGTSNTRPASPGGASHRLVRSCARAFPTQPDSVTRESTSIGVFGNQVPFLINPPHLQFSSKNRNCTSSASKSFSFSVVRLDSDARTIVRSARRFGIKHVLSGRKTLLNLSLRR